MKEILLILLFIIIPSTSLAKVTPFEGSGKGSGLGLMRGTVFCSEKDGSLDGEGFKSCAGKHAYIGNCADKKAKCIGECTGNKNCNYVKGACGTPNYYFYGNNRKNAVTSANKQIKEVALSRKNLLKMYGKGKSYCGKKVNICYRGVCKPYPVTTTGLRSHKTIDMTGAIFRDLGIPGRLVTDLTVFKI